MRGDARLRARAQRLQAGSRDWYRIKAAVEGEAEIWIQDEISWLGVTARDFINELRAVDAERITLHLNSPGGDVFDGIAIYDALKRHPAKVTARVTLAASIASVIAMAGDEVVMAEHSTLMIHDPYALTIGDARDHEKQAAVLNQIGDEIASIYAERRSDRRWADPVAHWRDVMREETWYTAQAAVDAGLADRVDAARQTEAANRFDLSVFRNAPAELPQARPDPRPAPPPVRPAYDTAALEGLRDTLRATRAA